MARDLIFLPNPILHGERHSQAKQPNNKHAPPPPNQPTKYQQTKNPQTKQSKTNLFSVIG